MSLRAGWFLIAVACPTLVHAQLVSFADLASTHLSVPGFATDGTEKDPDTGDGRNVFCLIQGPGSVPCATPATFTATSPASPTTSFTATFSLLNNTAGASFVGPSSCVNTTSCSVVVMATQSGSVVVRVILSFGGGVLKTCQVTLLVSGGGPPSIQCPPDVTVPCPGPIDPPVTGTPTYPNSCGPVTTSYVDAVTGSNCSGSIITRTWTATNSLGQSISCTQTISRSSVPSIACPAGITVQCLAQVPPPNIGSVIASDSCGGAVTVTHVGDVASNGTSNCVNSIARTYRATNACGVQANCTQTITVSDTTPPSITCPAPATVQCFSAVPAPNIGSVTASDNCGGAVTVTFVSDVATNGTSSCNNVITRTYRATDSCGNQNTCTQTITVNDTTPPTLTCPGALALQCFSQVPAPSITGVTATDNCGGTVTVTFVSDVATNGTSSCNNVITRTYQGVDACGNVGVCSQVITVNDTTPPTITCPGALGIQCFSNVPPATPGLIVASDNCSGPVTVTFVSDVATNGTSSCNNVITRTYQATDACGNTSTCAQTITVNDTTPPGVFCPPGQSNPCFAAVTPPQASQVATSDNCGGPVTVTFVSDVATNGTSSCNNVITRTYMGTDTCGNTATCTQIFTVNDTTPPLIACPGPVTVQCFSAVPAPSIGSVTAFDNCGAVTVTFVSDVATNGTSSCNNVITRTYRATDSCGNQNTCTQTITVNDTTPPTLTCPGALILQCFSQVPAPSITGVTATDNCGGTVTVTFVSDVATNGTSSCNNVITRTYQGVDACGNVGVCSQVITVNDTTPPTITCPGALGIQCFSNVPPATPGLIVASDNCGGPVTVTFVSDVATNGTSSCNNVITRTYQATDACGNTNTCTQTITVNDTTPPGVFCPPGQSNPCFAAVTPPQASQVATSDNCGGPVTVTFVSDVATNGTSSCNNVITRTYMGTDTCGNTATCTQIFTVNDTTPPSIICPGPVTVQCFSQVPAPSITGVTATDNCGGTVTVTFVSDAASNGTSSCNNVITRTYRATDACGNSNTCTQLITVNDTTPPSITCPAPATVQCFSAVPAPNTTAVTASDNCGGTVTVTFVNDVPSNGTSSCNNVITRTYRATDSCGNSNTCTQLITVNDTIPPSITCPAPATVQCFSAVPAPNTTAVTASDNCGGTVTVSFVGDSATNGTSSCNNVITRTYSATDACGNMNTCTQTITVNDTTPPTLTCPGALALQCFSQVPAPSITGVTATDNCGGTVTVTFVSDVATNGTSSCNNVITRTYQGVDACGNVGVCSQVITVNDTTPPTITCPGALGIQCFSNVPPATPGLIVASDNCGGPVTVTFVSDVATNGTSSCNNVITRTYQATDACGNTNTCTQTITVNDTTPPGVFCPPGQSNPCFAAVTPPQASQVATSDNCGGPVTVTFVSDVATNGTSSCNNVITRTYMGTDTCGNTATCTQIFTVNDTTPPLIACPGPVTVQCFSAVPAPSIGSVTAFDNCGAVTVTFVSDVASNGTSSCNNVITRTYTATDACGNMNTCTQIITVNDTTVPSLTCPAPIAVQCFAQVPPPNVGSVTATDNCGGTVTVTFVSDVPTNGTSNCMNVITRTYQGVDPCGNVGVCSQLITVNDTIPPVITCPVDITVACGSPTDPGTTGTATATDNCQASPVVSFSDVVTGICPTGGTITRTWTASDGCQSVSCTQTITLVPPETGCVFDLGGQCGGSTPAVLTASFGQSSLTPKITGATPNALVVLAAQLPPYGPATVLAGSCTLHLSPTFPPTLMIGTFQTDAAGLWTTTFNIPQFPKHIGALLQAVVSTPTPGPLGNFALTRALNVKRPCECTVIGSSIASNFNGTPIAAGRTIWFNAVLKPSRFPDTGATVRFHSSTIAFSASGMPYVLSVPAGVIVWDPAATTAETHFDVGAGEWRTTVPASYDKEVFLAGLGFPVTAALPGGIDPVTWRGSFSTDVERADFQWKWAAAVYTTFSTDPNAIGVKPVEGSTLSIYANADHAGTPENFKPFVIGGARGGGGSNYTGSYSGTERTGCNIIGAVLLPE